MDLLDLLDDDNVYDLGARPGAVHFTASIPLEHAA